MITFKLKDVKYEFPTCWPDVTYAQYVALLKTPNNIIDYVALFTGLDRAMLATAKLNGVEKIVVALSFLSTPPQFEAGPTRMVGPYPMPKDITLQSLGQFEDLRALIQQLPRKETKDYTIDDHLTVAELYLSACAIYVQKVINGEYDPEQVENVKLRLRIFSCIQVLQTGAFFFGRLLNTLTGTTTRSQKITQRLKKLLLDFPGYRRSLDFLRPSSRKLSG